MAQQARDPKLSPFIDEEKLRTANSAVESFAFTKI